MDVAPLSGGGARPVLDAAFAYDPDAERAALVQERDRLDREIENLTKGIATGGDIPELAAALQERDRQDVRRRAARKAGELS